jgi:hypothetical protein
MKVEGVTPASLEAIVRDIGHTIRAAVNDAGRSGGTPIGFAFFVFDFGAKGSMAYTANAARGDVVALLEELTATLRGDGQ